MGPGTSDQNNLGYKTSSKNFFISYILSNQVWWYNIKWFLNYFKNYIYKFMQGNSWHHKLLHFHFPLESGKCGKEEKKHKNVNISRMKKAF